MRATSEHRARRLTENPPPSPLATVVLPDLTVAENVTICRQWINPAPSKETKNAKGGDPSYLGRSVLPLSLLPIPG